MIIRRYDGDDDGDDDDGEDDDENDDADAGNDGDGDDEDLRPHPKACVWPKWRMTASDRDTLL